jgi:hypothetical protein
MKRKLTAEQRRKFLRWHHGLPEVRIAKEGTPAQITAILSEIERKDNRNQRTRNEQTCSQCGEKYEPKYFAEIGFYTERCQECIEAGKLDSGDYNFAGDEDE